MKSSSILLGLVGHGIDTSRSPSMHEAEGTAHGYETIYRLLDTATPELADRSLADIIDWIRAMGFNGFNVTHPYKQAIVDLLDEVDDRAAVMGSVNTVVIGEDGQLKGYNTDVTGFHRSLIEGLPGAALNSVVQVGTGGVGVSVAHALAAAGTTRLYVADLDSARASALATVVNEVAGREAVVGIEMSDLEQQISNADGVVNATPMGMAAHPGTPFNTSWLLPTQWVLDVVYMPIETQLLVEAHARGCRTLGGSQMCVYQAADAFRLFTGLEPDTTRMHHAFAAAKFESAVRLGDEPLKFGKLTG